MEIFSEALELTSAEERAVYLDRVCGPDRSLRGRVEGLLRAHVEDDDFLESPAAAPTTTGDSRPQAEGPETVIGPYKLREQIGEGGMGVVYVAEQSQPVRRKVALKIIKPGMDTRQVIARFEAERQALAMMDHPNIAKVHDGGTTELGRPYFVMELVRGLPITEYCDGERLPIRERLELFVLVCRAVQHAHQKGIIHRDLKPSNILVTLHDGVPVPKVIDFGVAKATGQSLTEKTVYTAFTQLVGTPLYMSPEQVEFSGLDVDTRSDIYSLGVLLYELLTGTTPFDSETLKKAAFDEMRRIIREEEPPKPSMRLSTLGETLTTVSARRGSDPRQLSPSIRGELDWIVMKALEKDRRRRYETANDFAADVMRYLTDQPVEACPPSARYRFGKFVRRNRASLAIAALVAVALLASTAVSLWQVMKARQAAGEARERAGELKQVVEYLAKDVFGASAPRKKSGRSVTVGELLDRADATLSERFRRRPLAEASVRMALAESYETLFDDARAQQNVVRAVQIRERYLGPEHPSTLEARALQAWILCVAGWDREQDIHKTRAAEPVARRVLASRRRVLGPFHADTLSTQCRLALTLSNLGRHEEAEGLAAQAEERAVRSLGPKHDVTLEAQHCLALIALRRGNLARAEALLRPALESWERDHGTLDAGTLYFLQDLAYAVRLQGRSDEARLLQLETVNRFAQAYGFCHIQTSPQIGYLLSLLREERGFAAIRDFCEGWLRESLTWPPEPDPYERSRRAVQLGQLASALATLPEDIPFDADLAVRAAEEAGAYGALARVCARLGRFDTARQRLSEVARRSAGDPRVLNNIAWTLATAQETELRDPAQAAALARKAVGLEPRSASSQNTLGVAHYRAGDWRPSIDALERSETLAPDKHVAFNGFFLAMAHWQLGDKVNARSWFDRAVQWMEKRQPQNEELRRFRAEAAELLNVRDELKSEKQPSPKRDGN
jgi:serine/threonine-protein kinase